jgi:hypothetical protein
VKNVSYGFVCDPDAPTIELDAAPVDPPDSNRLGTGPVYVLPDDLLDAIEREPQLRGWLTDSELAFERDLTARCEPAGWCGFVEDVRIACTFVTPPRAYADDLAAVADATGDEGLCTSQPSIAQVAIAEERLKAWDVQERAYVGWLLTHPEFVCERNFLREQYRRARRGFFNMFFAASRDSDSCAFLHRWGLVGMSSWDLPLPQGPNLTGLRWPDALVGERQSVQVEIPVTMTVQSCYPLLESLKEIRQRETPSHLAEWGRILGRSGAKKGLVYFQHVFRLHFYRNLALGTRYGNRFKGYIEPLDHAFGTFLGIRQDRVKRLRCDISHRLSGQ